jgi:hypothetical protein
MKILIIVLAKAAQEPILMEIVYRLKREVMSIEY